MKYLIIALCILLAVSLCFGYVMPFSTTFEHLNSLFGSINKALSSVTGTLGFNVFNVEIENSELLKATYSNGLTGYECIWRYLDNSARKVDNAVIDTKNYGRLSEISYVRRYNNLTIMYCSPYVWELSLSERTSDGLGRWETTQEKIYALVLNAEYNDTDGKAHNIIVALPLPTDNALNGEYISSDNGYVLAKNNDFFSLNDSYGLYVATNMLIMEGTNKFTPLFDLYYSSDDQIVERLDSDGYNLTIEKGYYESSGVWSANITPRYTFEQMIELMIQKGTI